MTVLILAGAVAIACLLYAVDRLVKSYRRGRQRRQMAYRLTAAAARADVAERKRTAAMAASSELTSVMPAINQPRPSFEAVARQAGGAGLHPSGTSHSPGGTGHIPA